MERGCEEIARLGPLKEGELRRFASTLADLLVGGEVIILSGELGSGKTTFVRGMAIGLGIDPKLVRSPTFTLLNVYPGRLVLNHADLYRIEDPGQLFYIGLEEILEDGEGVLAVEWGERFGDFWDDRIEIGLEIFSADERIIEISACGTEEGEIVRESIKRYEESR